MQYIEFTIPSYFTQILDYEKLNAYFEQNGVVIKRIEKDLIDVAVYLLGCEKEVNLNFEGVLVEYLDMEHGEKSFLNHGQNPILKLPFKSFVPGDPDRPESPVLEVSDSNVDANIDYNTFVDSSITVNMAGTNVEIPFHDFITMLTIKIRELGGKQCK